MQVKQFIDGTAMRLSEIYPPEEARAVAYRLTEHFFGVSRHQAILYPQKEINEIIARKAIEELLSHRPLQYVLGQTWFCDMELVVREGVLIPRPETEELVMWIARDNDTPGLRILDIGTGSGAIAISLARLIPSPQVIATDISSEAITIAKENATANGVNIKFILSDILKETPAGEYDIIVSNPPYITESEKTAMRNNVLEYEPSNALFVSDCDPLLFYVAIAEYARSHLSSGGKLYFEINERFGKETVDMLGKYGFCHIELRKDIFDKERMVKAVWR